MWEREANRNSAPRSRWRWYGKRLRRNLPGTGGIRRHGNWWCNGVPRPVVFDYDQDGINDLILVDHEGYLSFFRRVRKNGELVTLPGKRIFRDENGEELKLSEGEAGRSGRRKIDLVDWDGIMILTC
ncbi:MAG: hypothetical protein ACOX5R_23075 [bacterium]|jgi:hypothetical protein